MSEEMKKNLRTQGKYSGDKPFHKSRDKRLKDSPGEQEQPEKKSQKRNSNGCKQNTSYDESENESAVKYQVNSSHSFSELEDDEKPVEIATCGEHVLSETINGKSIVLYESEFINKDEADYLVYALDDSTQWNEKNIIIRGKEYPQPRLVAWYGPFPYSYSGVTLEPKEMPENVLRIKQSIEDYLITLKIDVTFNSVLLNCYRNGKDSVAWHSDDELTMGVCPTIASVSLGETRKFEIRRKMKSYEEEIDANQINQYFVHLTSGSLLIMDGSMQQDWQHRIPKEYHSRGKRINLTFRTVYPLDKIPPEMPTKEYKSSRITSKAWDTSSSYENYDPSYDEKDFPPLGNYDEKNFPPLNHSVEKNFPPLSHSVEKNFPPLSHSVEKDFPPLSHVVEKNFPPLSHAVEKNFPPLSHAVEKNFPPLGNYDEKKFSRLSHSVATSNKMDIEHETSDHEMDVESKDISLLNNTSMNSSVYSNAESNISKNFESSIVSQPTSEEHDISTEYFDDDSQNHDTYVGSNMNNLNDDKQNFKHKLNKNVHTFDNPLNDSDSMNPDEESVGHDESYTNSSAYKKHFSDAQETRVTKSRGSFCSIPPFSQNVNSNLNANAKEFIPISMSSPVSEEHIDDSISLEKLFTYDLREMEYEDFHDYAYHLRNKIMINYDKFGSACDELAVLCDLMEDELPPRCQKKITYRMCKLGEKYYKKDQKNSKLNTKNFSPAQQENKKEHGSYSRGRGYLGKRNENLRRQESSGRENPNRDNFNAERYTRSDFSRRYDNRRECLERENSNKEDDSKRENINREEYSRGGMTSRDGRYPNKRFGRGDSRRGGDFRTRIIKYSN